MRVPKRDLSTAYEVDPVTGCWVWLRAKSSNGYGIMGVKGGITFLAHRWFYQTFRAEIPAGLLIDHLCRNRGCVNPDHMDVVSKAVNTQRGVKASLVAAQVCEIRRLAAAGATPHDLACRFGVSETTIESAVTGRSWKNVDAPPLPRWRIERRPARRGVVTSDIRRAILQSQESAERVGKMFGICAGTVRGIRRRARAA